MKRLLSELVLYGGNNDWITVPYIKNSKATQTINKLLSLSVDKRI